MRSRAGGRGGARSARGTCLDLAYDCLGLFDETVGDQPARAFRNPTSHDENDKSYRGADQEGQPPSQRRVDKGWIEQDDRAACAHGRSDPEAAVDQEVSPAAQAGGNKLLDCRIDGSVFAADAGAGEEAEQHETPGVPRQTRGGGGQEIDCKRHEKQLLASQPIGQPTEEKGAQHRAGEIAAAGKADLRIAQA
jgi:hypothetical protein